MHIKLFALLVALVAARVLNAAEAPPVGVEMPGPAPVPAAAEAVYQEPHAAGSERRLDEAVFTEISPISVPDVGVRLPSDQED